MILSFILKRSFQAACGVCTGLVSNYIPVATKNRDNATARAGGRRDDGFHTTVLLVLYRILSQAIRTKLV